MSDETERHRNLTVRINGDASGLSDAIDGLRAKAKKLNKELEKTSSLLREISFRK